MMRVFNILCLVSLALLTACKTEDYQDKGELSIKDFYIVGTNKNNRDEVPEIDPYTNNGEFYIFVRLGKPDLGYKLNLYVASTMSTQNAIQIFTLSCDDDNLSCYDGDYLTLNCQFFTDMTGACAEIPYSLSNAIYTLPYSGYLIAEECHLVQHQCVISYQRTVFM